MQIPRFYSQILIQSSEVMHELAFLEASTPSNSDTDDPRTLCSSSLMLIPTGSNGVFSCAVCTLDYLLSPL